MSGSSTCHWAVLSSIGQLTDNPVYRRTIFEKLTLIHNAGVLHGDFSPRNVVVDDGGQPFLLDFSHSRNGHKCPGSMDCWELKNAARQLGLDLAPTATGSVDASNLPVVLSCSLSSDDLDDGR
jgi:serine/threonine protein kinase